MINVTIQSLFVHDIILCKATYFLLNSYNLDKTETFYHVGSQIRQLNQAKLIESLQTGKTESGVEGRTHRLRRNVVQVAVGWKHAVYILEEEAIL